MSCYRRFRDDIQTFIISKAMSLVTICIGNTLISHYMETAHILLYVQMYTV
jgi:hypothetical protein